MRESAVSRRRRRRTDLLWLVGMALLVVVLGWIVVTMQDLSASLHDANRQRDLLAQQVRDLGATPVVGPSGKPGRDGDGLPGQKGDKGDTGDSGSPGPSSTVPGPQGSPGSVGSPGPPGTSGIPGASGVPGLPGAAGSPGPSGAAGQSGQNGSDGKPGKDGADGRDGKDGQTCPDGYSLQPDPNDPDTLVCRRTTSSSAGSDAEPTGSASPAPSDTPLLPSLLGLITR